MPVIAVYEYLTFFAYMYDVIGTEPPHLHVSTNKGKSGKTAKIWVNTLLFAEVGDLTKRQQKLVVKLVEVNREALLEQYVRIRAEEKTERITLKLKK